MTSNVCEGRRKHCWLILEASNAENVFISVVYWRKRALSDGRICLLLTCLLCFIITAESGPSFLDSKWLHVVNVSQAPSRPQSQWAECVPVHLRSRGTFSVYSFTVITFSPLNHRLRCVVVPPFPCPPTGHSLSAGCTSGSHTKVPLK